MSDNPGARAPCTGGPQLENIAAELTGAIYPLVLRHGFLGSWLDLELGLWRALASWVLGGLSCSLSFALARMPFEQRSGAGICLRV